MSRITTLILLVGLVAPVTAPAQLAPPTADAPTVQPLKLGGPRFGLTYLPQGVRDAALQDLDVELRPVISQFGWQWETRFFSSEGITGMSEWVLLVGGLEANQFIPSLSWILGIRTPNGTEVGVGPNIGVSGTALAVAGGITLQSGPIYLPMNVAIVPGASGVRVSVLSGFIMRPSR
jgi:hypothetical protein